jgi:hypothetical protein
MLHADSQAASIMMLSYTNLLAIVGTLRDQEKKRAQVGSLQTLLLLISVYNKEVQKGYTSKKNVISVFQTLHPILANVHMSHPTADVMTVTKK